MPLHSGHLVCKDQQARSRVVILAESEPLGCFSVLSCPVVTINGQMQLLWAKKGQWSGAWISRQATEPRGGASWGQRNLAWLTRKETVSTKCVPQRAAAAGAVIHPTNAPLLSFHQESQRSCSWNWPVGRKEVRRGEVFFQRLEVDCGDCSLPSPFPSCLFSLDKHFYNHSVNMNQIPKTIDWVLPQKQLITEGERQMPKYLQGKSSKMF